MPGLEVARAAPWRRETVAAFLRRTGWASCDPEYGWQFRKGLPTILEINGEAVLRKDWRRRRICAADVVRFMSYPLGGNGGGGAKQVIGLVALVAVAAFATFVTGGGAAALLGSAFASGTFGAAALGAGIALGGAMLVNALVAPKAGATNTPGAATDQIYSVQAQGNTARLGQPLPIWYGRLKAYPDFAATPWGEFVGNDQYLNVLLSVTMGSMDYEAVYVDDTVFWDSTSGIAAAFTDAQIAFYEPGAEVTLFPTNVDQSAAVSGQQLPDGAGLLGGQYVGAYPTASGDWLGPFAANPPGTQAQSIAVDFVFPGGCYSQDQDHANTIGYINIGLTAEYCFINDAGAQISPFIPLASISRRYASRTPVRDSVKVDVPAGRYAVRFRREDASLQDNRGVTVAIWAGLRSFLKGSNSFPDVSTVAIRLKASQSTQGSYKFGVLGTRKLPVWNGSIFALQPTRSNAWAFLDAVSNGQYGSGLPISKVDFNAVMTHATGCDARGDTFDYRFSAAVTVPEALDKILTPSRARHFWLGDTVSIVRDEWRDVPSMLLTDREIVRDTTRVAFTMLGDEDPDAVILEYIDEDTWLPAQVQYPPNSVTFTAGNAETKRLDGVVNRDHAFRECAFYYLQSIYRRENIQLDVEYEGRAITFGSVVRVQSELPMAYGYGGAVVAAAGRTLTLDPAPGWDAAPFYIRLRQPNGESFGPILCTQGLDATRAVLDAGSLAAAEAAQSTTLAAVLAREAGAEDPSFELGSGENQSRLCVVLNGAPKGELCTLSLVVDDARVHATDLGNPPTLPNGQFPANDKVPLIAGLNANFGQGTAEPKLMASWFPSAGALYYIAAVSYDAGVSWIQVYEGADNRFEQVVTLGAIRLRVQAVNQAVRGPYATLDLDAPTIAIAPGTATLDSLIEGIRYNITTLQQQHRQDIADLDAAFADQMRKIAARLALAKEGQNQQSWDQLQQIQNLIQVTADGISASIDDVRTVALDTQTAFADYKVTTTAHFGNLDASVSTHSSAIAGINGVLGASWGVAININGVVTGAARLDGGANWSVFTIQADKLQFQLPSVNGGAPVTPLVVGTVNGVPSFGFVGNMYLDGSIFTRMIGAAQVTAVNMAADSITAENGAIKNLSVQSFKIGDQAVTVPYASQFIGPHSFSGSSFFTVFSTSLTIDTSGLAGKIIPIYVNCVFWAGTTLAPAASAATFSITVNGTQIQSATGVSQNYDVTVPAAGALNLIANGGVMSIPVVVTMTAGNYWSLWNATVFAMAAKR